jgi:hypothetical protein
MSPFSSEMKSTLCSACKTTSSGFSVDVFFDLEDECNMIRQKIQAVRITRRYNPDNTDKTAFTNERNSWKFDDTLFDNPCFGV